MDVRDNISAYIKDKAIKQATIAERAKITPSKLCATLKKKRALDANEFFNICDAMGIGPEQLRNYEKD